MLLLDEKVNYNKAWLKMQPVADYIFFFDSKPSNDGNITSACFSEWWPSKFTENGITYRTAGHYLLSWKAKLFSDVKTANEIIEKRFPKDVKALAKHIINFDSSVWKEYRYDIMKQGNYLKFSQNSALRQFLLSTGNSTIAAANPTDKVWGIGLAAHDSNAYKAQLWPGENLLGFALMQVRDELKDNCDESFF